MKYTMTKFGKLTISTYSSLLTGKRTILTASVGKCGHEGYKEAQVRWNGKAFTYIVTDGYKGLSIGSKLKERIEYN